jgi:aspartate carbamoyltransferase regulatory subunit
MLKTEMIDKLNEQMNLELFSSLLYQQMSAWCSYHSFEGAAAFLRRHAQEEMTHMQRLFDYLTDTGSLPRIAPVASPFAEYGSLDELFRATYFLTDEQVNQLSLYAPDATVNRIDDYEVVGKSRPSLPERIESVLICPNSNCISHAEPVSSCFSVKKRANDIALKCKYCEKEFSHNVVLAG